MLNSLFNLSISDAIFKLYRLSSVAQCELIKFIS